jgi:acetylornithine deacetylase/succinyl-diaminopimelate desuccinylase family protein
MPLTILKKLISFNTENLPGDEYQVVAYLSELFSKHNITFKKYTKEKGRENIVAEIGSGKPRLLVACHADTVPAGEGWDSDPFVATVKNGRVYGRGVVDDKGPLAALVKAAISIKNDEKKLKGTLVVGCFADEEKGSDLGLKWLVNSGKVKADFAIMPDIGDNMKSIDVAEKGVLQLGLVSKGKVAHGSWPKDGVNAITNLMEVLTVVKDYTFSQKKHSLLSKCTLNIGQIEGGNAPNMVPSSCVAVLDIRYLPSQTPAGIIEEVEKIISQVKNKSLNVKVEVINQLEATELNGNNTLISTIQKVVKKELGFKPKCIGLNGATDAKAFILKGIPAVGWSCGDHDQMHVPNESISVKELEQFSHVLEKVVKEFLS